MISVAIFGETIARTSPLISLGSEFLSRDGGESKLIVRQYLKSSSELCPVNRKLSTLDISIYVDSHWAGCIDKNGVEISQHSLQISDYER
jgi:hypothetical protein